MQLFDKPKPLGDPKLEHVVETVDVDWTADRPDAFLVGKECFVLWTATLQPAESGEHEFVIDGAEHAALMVDGEQLIHRWVAGGPTRVSKSLKLEAGRVYSIQVRMRPADAGPVRVRLGWTPPSASRSDADLGMVVEAARQADAVVLVGGLNHQYDVEGCDRRDMSLHDGQNELIEALASANAKLVVVLVSGCPVEMPWIERVPAVVQMWYAGMEGGNALADLLLGRVNPSGKLPFTFPRKLSESPAHLVGEYKAGICHYHEGIYVGYRHYCTRGVPVLFPFGHGLSYTHFGYKDLVIETTRASGDSRVLAQFTLTNDGPCEGAEVVQLYVRDEDCSMDRPDRELKGFAKVRLAAGESRTITLSLDREAFSFYDPVCGWVLEPGRFSLLIGSSCQDIRLTGGLMLDDK